MTADAEVQALYTDFKRSYKAWRTGRQQEPPTGFDFPELTGDEMRTLCDDVDRELDNGTAG